MKKLLIIILITFLNISTSIVFVDSPKGTNVLSVAISNISHYECNLDFGNLKKCSLHIK